MTKSEAYNILSQYLAKYVNHRALDRLAEVNHSEDVDVRGKSGINYCVRVRVLKEINPGYFKLEGHIESPAYPGLKLSQSITITPPKPSLLGA